jgi:hypothetical protein
VPERLIWQGKIGPAFWTVASLISLTVNIFLIIVLFIVAQNLFAITRTLETHLIDGLNIRFNQLDNAQIKTTITVRDTIQVNDEIPVVFDLPLQQNTTVTLTRDTPVKQATVYLNGAPVPTDIILRKGTKLDIALDLTVPVNQTVPVVLEVPVNMEVPVEIALKKTSLHDPFYELQEKVLLPYVKLLQKLPHGWGDTAICQPAYAGWFCKIFLGTP